MPIDPVTGQVWLEDGSGSFGPSPPTGGSVAVPLPPPQGAPPGFTPIYNPYQVGARPQVAPPQAPGSPFQRGRGSATAPTPVRYDPAQFIAPSVAYRPTNVNDAAQLSLYLTNRATQWMDPANMQATRQYLYSADPVTFAAYAPASAGPGGIGGQFPTYMTGTQGYPAWQNYQRLQAAQAALTPQAINQALGGGVSAQNQQGLAFLQNYLTAASRGLPSAERPNQASRAWRRWSQQRLADLEEQAQKNPQLSQYLTVGQNLVNPTLGRGLGIGGPGQENVVFRPKGPVRGFTTANPMAL